MTATTFYRIAAVVFVLFAAGHTMGFLRFVPATVEGKAVLDGMNSAHFDFGGRRATYADFYKGFGLTCTVYLLFSAFLAWHLGALAQATPQTIGMLGWAFFATQAVALVITGFYFALIPTVFSAAAAVCLALGAWLNSH